MTATEKELTLALAAGIGRDHGVRASQRDQYGTSSTAVPVPTEIQARRALGATYDLAPRADRPALIEAFLGGWHQARRLVGYPVGIQEIAEKLGVARATVDQWIQRGIFPAQDWTVGGRPAWDWSTVRRWAETTNRYSEGTMKIWTLSTSLSRDALQSVLAELDLGDLSIGPPAGLQSGATVSLGSRSGPPAELETVRRYVIDRGDQATY